jgi:hypothetical protein
LGELHNSIGGSQQFHQALTHKEQALPARVPRNPRVTINSMKWMRNSNYFNESVDLGLLL